MRIDPTGTIGEHPALFVRKLMRKLTCLMYWRLETLVEIGDLGRAEAWTLLKTLEREGFVKLDPDVGRKSWKVTQLGQSFASATAAKPITRQTAERTISEFLERVRRVNEDHYFLAQVTKVVLFGSFLRAGVDRLSDVDVAVQLEPKESDSEFARMLNEQRVDELAARGRRFGSVFECELCWYWETFRYLKGRSRSLALADYKVEKTFVDGVTHRVLLGDSEENRGLAHKPALPRRRRRRPKDCPF